MKDLYIPVKTISLAHYFGSACIKPSKYFDNKSEDIQDIFSDYLLISEYAKVKNSDCAMQIVLTDQEADAIMEIPNNQGFYLFDKPLPITRIKKIYFEDEDRLDHVITSIQLSTAFIASKLAVLFPQNEPEYELIITDKEFDKVIAKDFSEDIKRFDSLLGGLALMKLAGEEYMNYSQNYFSALSFFNETIKQELLNQEIAINEKIYDAFDQKGFFGNLKPYLEKTLEMSDLEKIAEEEKQKIEKDIITRLINLKSLKKGSLVIATLLTYGVGLEGKKNIDSLIFTNFRSEIDPSNAELVALCYGMNKGYSVFNNEYKSGEKTKKVKYELNSMLDYYTIESIFQFAINNKKTNTFAYLDSWCPKKPIPESAKNQHSYVVLDELVLGEKKPGVFSSDYLSNLLSEFFQKEARTAFENLFKMLRDKIYKDTKDEISEFFTENNPLKKELNEAYLKIKRLEEDLQVINRQKYKDEVDNNSTEFISKSDIEKIHKDLRQQVSIEVANYLNMTRKDLEEEAKKRSINSKTMKVNDIIVALLKTPKN